MTEPRTWMIRLPYTRPPLSLNGREHWRTRARHAKTIRAHVREWATYTIPNLERVAVELHYVPRDARRRDADNLVPNLKHAIDGLVDAGIVADDTPEFVTWTVHIDSPDRTDPHLFIKVTEVETA